MVGQEQVIPVPKGKKKESQLPGQAHEILQVGTDPLYLSALPPRPMGQWSMLQSHHAAFYYRWRVSGVDHRWWGCPEPHLWVHLFPAAHCFRSVSGIL